MLHRALQPLVRIARRSITSLPRPIHPFASWRIDDPGNVAARGTHKPHATAEELRDTPGSVPRNDMVLFRPDRVGVLANAGKINRLALEGDFAGFDQIVLHVGIAQVPAMGRPRHASAITVPIQEV